MIDRATELALADDLPEVEAFLAECGGELVADETIAGLFWLALHPVGTPGEAFHARVEWFAYPDAAPSVKYATAVGGSTAVPSAWPNVPGYRPSEQDICKPFTAEAYRVHPEWRDGPTKWLPDGNPFLQVVMTLQDDLDHRYQGRAA